MKAVEANDNDIDINLVILEDRILFDDGVVDEREV